MGVKSFGVVFYEPILKLGLGWLTTRHQPCELAVRGAVYREGGLSCKTSQWSHGHPYRRHQ